LVREAAGKGLGETVRALIIDDQPLIVSGLQAVMAGLRASLAVSCAESPHAARRLLTSDLHFDLVLLDLELEGAGGFDFLAELRDAHPTMSIVVLSASNANDLVSRAIFLGAASGRRFPFPKRLTDD
jgi:DNA-binding NarL/FixJ family response regulator